MKKLYIILALVVVSILMVFAGDTIKILRIYHNGTYTAIPLANIDSIEHSKYDADWKKQANYTSSIIEALDSTYNIPINVIDSVAVTDEDIKQSLIYAEEIRQYLISLSEQQESIRKNNSRANGYTRSEQSIEDIFSNILKWLSNKDFVTNVVLSTSESIINITLPTGLNFIINFTDYDIMKGKGTTSNKPYDFGLKFIDVSSKFGEKIIDKPDILYIQGRTMYSFTEQELSNSDSEHLLLNYALYYSPINGNVIKKSKSINFMYEHMPNYGLIIVGQTHGIRSGMFQVEENNIEREIATSGSTCIGLQVSLLGETFKCSRKEPIMIYVPPRVIKKYAKLNSIIYGNYCWSYSGLSQRSGSVFNRESESPVVFGYDSSIEYCNTNNNPWTWRSTDSLVCHVTKLLNGFTFNNAIGWDKYYQGKYNGVDKYIIPASNNKDSKLRYFSISTEHIAATNEIKGKIEGFNNLRTEYNQDKVLNNQDKDIIKKWILYVHEGLEKFIPGDNNVKRIEDAYKPDANGNFIISSDIVRQYPNHQFLVGFEYADKVYYGRVSEISVSIEDISPVCDNFEVIIKGKVNGYEKLRTKDVGLYVCKSKEVISNYSQSLNYPDFKYEYYKSFTAYLDEKNGNIECRVRRDYFFDANTIYSFAFVLDNGGTSYYSDTKYCIWKLCPDNNHPHSIDFGLGDGILWACCNVGANKPEGYGDYFAWGETKKKPKYFYDNYDYYDEEKNLSDHYTHIGNNISGTSYDAARKNWGASWRMPTSKEIKTLGKLNYSNNDFIINGVPGVTITGPNGNSIFIPYAGYRWNDELEGFNGCGYYWSSTLEDQNTDWWNMYYKEQFAFYATIHCTYFNVSGAPIGERIKGFSIRPVCNGEAPTDLCLSENNLSMNTKDNKIIDISSGSGDYAVTNSNPEVLSVTLNGNEVVITALSAGEATITVTDNQTGQTTSLIVSVSGESNKLSLSRSSLSDLGVGNVATVYIESGNGDYIVESDNNKIATATLIGSSIIIKALSVGTATITISDKQSGQTATINVNVIQSDGPTVYRNCPDSNHPHMIDIGLSTKWACCNVGASNPNDYGCYFAWGETDVKSAYETNNYLYADEDVATVLWGDNWKMPTYNQIYELIYTGTSEVTKGGRWFTGPNGRSIFFPAAGNRFLGVHNDEDHGHYWTGTLFPDDKNLAYILYFGLGDGNDGVTWRFANRSYGLSVRPVAK